MGTKNAAKIDQVKSALKNLDITVSGLPDNFRYPIIEENYSTVLENACYKAKTYAKLINQPVLSMDNALYLEGLNPKKQPGLNVRRIKKNAERPSDEELIDYYSKLIKDLGGKVNGYWEYGLCLALPNGETKTFSFKSPPRIFVSQPSKVITPGYPLESLQIDSLTGQYSSEMLQTAKNNYYQGESTSGASLRKFILGLPKNFI